MLGWTIIFCILLLVTAADLQSLKFKGIAEKKSIDVEPLEKLSAYIKDKQCDALIAYPGVLPCEPEALRVEVLDSTPFPDVGMQQLTSAVVRRVGCDGQAQVNVVYTCKSGAKKSTASNSRRGYELETYEDITLDSASLRSGESESEEILYLPSTPEPEWPY